MYPHFRYAQCVYISNLPKFLNATLGIIGEERKKKRTMEKELHLKVRISESDKNKIKENAKKAELTVSQFARKMLIEGKINVVDKADARVRAGIGNNLNQLAKLNNAGQPLPDRLIDILEDLKNKL